MERRLGASLRRIHRAAIMRAADLVLRYGREHGIPLLEAIEFPTRTQVLARWNRVKSRLKISNPHAFDPSRFPMSFSDYRLSVMTAQERDGLASILADIQSTAAGMAMAAASNDMGIERALNAAALEAVRDKAFKIVTTDLIPSLEAQLRDAITASIEQGMSVEETAHSLGFLNTNWRTTARTEVLDVTNQGFFDQAEQDAALVDGETFKGWLHSGGGRDPRPAHIEAAAVYGDGNEIPLDQPFIVGGEEMMHPHDPDASAEQNINCGCSLYLVVR